MNRYEPKWSSTLSRRLTKRNKLFRCEIVAQTVAYQEAIIKHSRVISRNLKLGGVDKCLGGEGVGTCAKHKFVLKNIKKHKKHAISGGGVVSQLGEGLYPPTPMGGGVLRV